MAKRVSLDWLEISVFPNNDQLKLLVDYFSATFQAQPGSSSRFYDSSLVALNGAILFFDRKWGLKNSPLYLRFPGQFFQLADAEEIIDGFIHIFQCLCVRYRFARVDACIDLVSQLFGDLEPTPVPQSFSDKHKIKTVCDADGFPETYFFGKSDFRMRVYNKLVECPFYGEIYGYDNVTECWRIECQLRGNTLVNLQQKVSVESYQDLLRLAFGQLGRRVAVDGVFIPTSEVSGYLRREPQIEYQIEYALNKVRTAVYRLRALNHDYKKVLSPPPVWDIEENIFKEPLDED